MAFLEQLLQGLTSSQTPWAKQQMEKMVGPGVPFYPLAVPAPVTPAPSGSSPAPSSAPEAPMAPPMKVGASDAPGGSGMDFGKILTGLGVNPALIEGLGIGGGDQQQLSGLVYNELVSRNMNPNTAKIIASRPEYVKAMLPQLFQQSGAQPPKIETIDLPTGEKMSVTWDQKTGKYMPIDVPGAATGAQTSRLDTKGAPSGYHWVTGQDGQKRVERIPGFEQTVPGEVAGKVAMMNMARERIKGSRATFEKEWESGDLAKWAAANVPFVGDVPFLSGDVGLAQRDIQTGIEAALRTMTGAAAPDGEVLRYARMFMPGPTDTKDSAKQKIDGLMKFMEDAEKIVMQGRGTVSLSEAGAMLEKAAGGQAQNQNTDAPTGMPEGAKQAPDGNFYVPDPNRPGKFLMVK